MGIKGIDKDESELALSLLQDLINILGWKVMLPSNEDENNIGGFVIGNDEFIKECILLDTINDKESH